jgi:hypothetical protein
MSFFRFGDNGCCWARCTNNVMEVQAPPGNVIGQVKQNCSFCRCVFCSPDFYVTDVDGTQHLFDIHGPCCSCKCCSAADYEIVSRTMPGNNGRFTIMACGCCDDVNLWYGNWQLVCKSYSSWHQCVHINMYVCVCTYTHTRLLSGRLGTGHCPYLKTLHIMITDSISYWPVLNDISHSYLYIDQTNHQCICTCKSFYLYLYI